MHDTSDHEFDFDFDEFRRFDYQLDDAANYIYSNEFGTSGNNFFDTTWGTDLASDIAARNQGGQHKSITQSFHSEQQHGSSRTLSVHDDQSCSRTPFTGPQAGQSRCSPGTCNTDDICENWLNNSCQPSATLAQSGQLTGVPQTSPPLPVPSKAQLPLLAPTPPGTKRKEPGVPPPRPSKRRRRLGSPVRAARKVVRQAGGACIRCKMFHEQCTEGIPCDRCHAITNSAVFFQPCTRDLLTKIMTFRSGNSRAGMLPAVLPKLQWCREKGDRILNIVCDFKGLQLQELPFFKIECRKFVPQLGPLVDRLDDTWVEPCDGKVHMLKFPAFACVSLQRFFIPKIQSITTTYKTNDTKHAMKAFLERCRPLLEAEMEGETHDEDMIVRSTVAEAMRFASQSRKSIVDVALKLRAFAYFGRKSLLVADGSAIPPPEEDGIPYEFPSMSGRAPVPSVMDLQFDAMAIEYMTELLLGLTKAMHKMLFGKNRRRHWYELYLCIFVLLATLEYVHRLQSAHLQEFQSAAMAGEHVKRIDWYTEQMVAEWEISAGHLIYHYNYILCETMPFGPLDEATCKSLAEVAQLDDEAVQYAQKMRRVLQDRRADLSSAREQPGRPLRWLSSLFLRQD